MKRHRYETNRVSFIRSAAPGLDGIRIRQPTEADHAQLADLMMSAYVGTIDYDGETPADAADEVAGWLAGEASVATSLVAVHQDRIVSAVLSSMVAGDPLVGYVMTRAEWKRRGLARSLLDAGVDSILAEGHERVSAWITAGNRPSERLFTGAGFVVVETLGFESS